MADKVEVPGEVLSGFLRNRLEMKILKAFALIFLLYFGLIIAYSIFWYVFTWLLGGH